MELNKFHIDELGTRVIGENVAVARSFPTVACDLKCPSDTARRQHNCLRLKNPKTPMLSLVSQTTNDAVTVL